jgi:Holliday junction resolvasome RuvABC DNA-binding subunit
MSYENQTTYVDTESSKMLANAITGIGQVTAKYISDDVKKRAKIAEENKIENKKRDQAFKRNQAL